MRSTVQIVATFDEHNRSKENAVHKRALQLRDQLKQIGADDVTVQVASTTAQPQPNPLASLKPGAEPRGTVDPKRAAESGGQYL